MALEKKQKQQQEDYEAAVAAAAEKEKEQQQKPAGSALSAVRSKDSGGSQRERKPKDKGLTPVDNGNDSIHNTEQPPQQTKSSTGTRKNRESIVTRSSSAKVTAPPKETPEQLELKAQLEQEQVRFCT